MGSMCGWMTTAMLGRMSHQHELCQCGSWKNQNLWSTQHVEKWVFLKTCRSVANDQMWRPGGGSTGADGAGKGGCFPLCRFWKSHEHNMKSKVSIRTGQSGSSSYSCVGYIYMHFTRETSVSSDQAVWGTRSGSTPMEQAILAQVILAH